MWPLVVGLFLPILHCYDGVEYTSPSCQLPEYTEILPLHYRRELKKIWGGLPTSLADCQRQMAATQAIISKLPEELRQKVNQWGAEPAGHPSKTSFLAGLSSDQIREFSNIMSTRRMTVADRSQRLRSWGKNALDVDAMERLEDYVKFLERRADRFREKVKRLSPDARLAFSRLESLKKERQTIFKGLTDKVKKELAQLFRMKCPRYGSGDGTDLDAEELQLACVSVEQPKKATTVSPTTTSMTSTTTTATTTNAPTTTAPKSIIIEVPSTKRYRPNNGNVPQQQTVERTNIPIIEPVVGHPGDVLAAWELINEPAKLSDLLRILFHKKRD